MIHPGTVKQTACAVCWPYWHITLGEKLGYIGHSLRLFLPQKLFGAGAWNRCSILNTNFALHEHFFLAGNFRYKNFSWDILVGMLLPAFFPPHPLSIQPDNSSLSLKPHRSQSLSSVQAVLAKLQFSFLLLPFNSNVAFWGHKSCRMFTFRTDSTMDHGSPENAVCQNWRTVSKPVTTLPV